MKPRDTVRNVVKRNQEAQHAALSDTIKRYSMQQHPKNQETQLATLSDVIKRCNIKYALTSKGKREKNATTVYAPPWFSLCDIQIIYPTIFIF